MVNGWELLWKLIPQVLAAVAAIEARGGHGRYTLNLDVVDKATGQDVIPAVEVAEITL